MDHFIDGPLRQLLAADIDDQEAELYTIIFRELHSGAEGSESIKAAKNLARLRIGICQGHPDYQGDDSPRFMAEVVLLSLDQDLDEWQSALAQFFRGSSDLGRARAVAEDLRRTRQRMKQRSDKAREIAFYAIRQFLGEPGSLSTEVQDFLSHHLMPAFIGWFRSDRAKPTAVVRAELVEAIIVCDISDPDMRPLIGSLFGRRNDPWTPM